MASALGGREALLHNVPGSFSAALLKDAISKSLGIFSYDFLVLLQKTAEDLVWEFSSADPINTARLIMPDYEGKNALDPLIGKSLAIQDAATNQIQLPVEAVATPITRKEKFKDLNASKYNQPNIKAGQLLDGIIGTVVNVDLCTFNDKGSAIVAKTWSSKASSTFNKFSFFGDEINKRFQVCLLEENAAHGKVWEWFDIQFANLRGIIFDPSESGQGTKTAYFIVDKPPQFYRRSHDDPGESFTDTPEKDLSPRALDRTDVVTSDILQGSPSVDPDVRIRYPSGLMDNDYGVSKIPWEVQFCRVFKIEYQPQTQRVGFAFNSISLHLTKSQKEDIILLNSKVAQETGATSGLFEALNATLSVISKLPSIAHISLLKLIYNCNVSPFASSQVDDLIRGIEAAGLSLVASIEDARKLSDLLERSAHIMETAHRRALRTLHNATNGSPQDAAKRLPANDLHPAVRPDASIKSVWDNQYFQSQLPRIAKAPKVFTFMVYPSHLEIYGPDMPPENSITQTHRAQIDRFIRVRFLENDGKPFRPEPLISPDKIITHRIFKILNNDTPLFDLKFFDTQKFEYLGYSVSSLKKRKMVWFYRRDDDAAPANATTIRNSIGLWDVSNPRAKSLAKAPWKWGARIALAFTTSVPIEDLDPSRWTSRPDFPDKASNPNTDGCGMISQSLSNRINEVLVRQGYHRSNAFQIRFGGVKGVVHTAPPRLFKDFKGGLEMVLRDSQVKFDVPDPAAKITFRVVSTAAEPQCCLFSPPVLKALEDMGSNVNGIKKSFEDAFSILSKLTGRTIDFLREVLRVPFNDAGVELGSADSLLKLAIALKNKGVLPDKYSESFLGQYLQEVCTSRLTKKFFEIPIPDSYFTLGLTDDYQLLEKETVYIRAGGATIDGRVLVYRNPVIHIGDIQIATGMSDTELQTLINQKYTDKSEAAQIFSALQVMDNVIFFSQVDQVDGKPPLPNRLSGGDLDGDRFEVVSLKNDHYWGHGIEPRPWSDYVSTDKPKEKDTAWNIRDLCQFISEYIRNDCFDALEKSLDALADLKGLNNDDVKEFSTFISTAVDYAKNGTKADFRDITSKEKFRIQAKPDFMQSLGSKLRHDTTGQYYPSTNLLGDIFRTRQKLLATLPKRDPDEIAQLKNDRLADELEKLFPASEISKDVTTELKTMEKALEKCIGEYSAIYRGYLKGRHIRLGRETDIFAPKPLDNFPQPHVTSLVDGLLEVMISGNIISLETNEAAQAVGYRIRLAAGKTRELAEMIFKRLALRAWTYGLKVADENGSYGVSFAFLALYTFFCINLPASRDIDS